MRHIEKYIFGLIIAFCLCSCFHTSNVAMVLDRAEMYLATSPDSAFVQLDSIDRSMLKTKELQARHALLYSQALEKVGIEVYPACDFLKVLPGPADEAVHMGHQ